MALLEAADVVPVMSTLAGAVSSGVACSPRLIDSVLHHCQPWLATISSLELVEVSRAQTRHAL